MTLWPAITAGFFWVEHRGTLDLVLFVVLVVSGGISYIYLARWRQSDPRDAASGDPGTVNPLYLLSEGTPLDFVEVWNPRLARTLPKDERSIIVVTVSFSIVTASFFWLWVRSSRYIVTDPEPTTAITAMGILSYLFVGVLLGSALWTRRGADRCE